MHIYARFSRFRILADKKKCISCNVCTSVCHQGIDVMNFANKGLPMEDPRVRALLRLRAELPDRRAQFRAGSTARPARCSLSIRWRASPVRMAELTVNGNVV